MKVNVFEMHYREKGLLSQRRYPNEAFINFIASHYFSLNKQDRAACRMLELGCGSGANLWMVAHEGFDAYGIDIAPTGIEYCESVLEHWGTKAMLEVGDVTKLPYQPEVFDVVFDVVTLQHLTFSQHLKAYSEAFRCLKSGGKFFSYHLGENSISLRGAKTMLDHCTVTNIEQGYPLANNGQTCFISSNEARRLLMEAGFSNINIEKVTRSYDNGSQYIEYLIISADKIC